MRWFRFYSEVVHDPKVQQLPPATFKQWINLLCIACENGGTLPKEQDIAYTMRMSVMTCRSMLISFKKLGLLDQDMHGTLKPHNWDSRQFQSDVSTERVRKFRERQKQGSEVVTETVSETFQGTVTKRPRARDTDTDTEYTPIVPATKRTNGLMGCSGFVADQVREIFDRIFERHAKNYRHAMKTMPIQEAWVDAIEKRPDDPVGMASVIDKAHTRECATENWRGKYRPSLEKWLRDAGWMNVVPDHSEPEDQYRSFEEVMHVPAGD